MIASRRKGLGLAALAVAVVSVVAQTATMAIVWWNSEFRLSCSGLHWGEWFSCMHASASHVIVAEISISAWIAGGVTVPLARFLPPYVSVIVPAGLAVVLAWLLARFWFERYEPRIGQGFPLYGEIYEFTVVAGTMVFVLVGPVATGWLLGLLNRARRRQPRLATVFE